MCNLVHFLLYRLVEKEKNWTNLSISLEKLQEKKTLAFEVIEKKSFVSSREMLKKTDTFYLFP